MKDNVNQKKDYMIKDIINKLSKDKHYSVRGSVARNANTPIDILIKLSEDKNCSVKKNNYWKMF